MRTTTPNPLANKFIQFLSSETGQTALQTARDVGIGQACCGPDKIPDAANPVWNNKVRNAWIETKNITGARMTSQFALFDQVVEGNNMPMQHYMLSSGPTTSSPKSWQIT